MNYSKKAEDITPSITLSINTKAKELAAKGEKVVSFGAGEPDFNTPKHIIEAAVKAMNDGKTKYTATPGIIELREAICNKLKKDNELEYETDQIVVSTGAKQCLFNSMIAILNQGDEVLLPSAYWVSYCELIKLAGGTPVVVNTTKEDNYKYSAESLKKAITSKTKAIILNSPNNPTGVVYTKDELMVVAEIAKENDLIIISDEIYEKLIYDGEKHISIASLSEDSFNRTIVINGFSKAYAMTGWRLGYTASSKRIAKLISAIQSHATSNPTSISQYAGLAALNGSDDEMRDMVNEFRNRRNYMLNEIKKNKKLTCIEPKGAFYIMINIKEYFGMEFNGVKVEDSVKFAQILLEEEKVAVVPGAGFGLGDYIRLSYATSLDDIKIGLSRIENFLKKFK
ncbi:MAG: pyridoxal phosphate-dependent aminotransferase [Clostridiaceae bacterium]|nr:pyridoxal phosphate-dependent aminotransferase [Clostridiaceae bacterium]